jgi:hypothetical protein
MNIHEFDPLPISEFDREHVELAMAGDWWSSDLLRLLAKSDRAHLERLRLVFPSHVAAFEAWHNTGWNEPGPVCTDPAHQGLESSS